MTNPSAFPPPPADSAYIAHLWDYPDLTVAIFGLQAHSQAAYALYVASGIEQEQEQALAQAEGLLCVRNFMEGSGALQLQYWRSHEDLAHFSRQMPHMGWWKWLNNNKGQGFSFYHEIYRCKTAEAVYEVGAIPVGPAAFCQTSAVTSGEGKSQERQRKFVEAAGSQ